MNNETIIRYVKGELNSAETREFVNWVKLDPANADQLKEMQQAWALSSVVNGDFGADTAEEYRLFQYRLSSKFLGIQKSKKVKVLQWIAGVAASLLIFWGGYQLHSMTSPTDNLTSVKAFNEIITLAGEKTKVVLADGSVVWVNSCTRIQYPVNLNGATIDFYLEGEAYFDFKKIKGREIVVHTSQIDVKVLGTAFNLRSYSDEDVIETTLVRGVVEIEKKNFRNKQSQHLLRLEPNQTATFIKGSNSASVKTLTGQPREISDNQDEVLMAARLQNANLVVTDSVNMDLKVSWKDGRMNFKSETFSNLVKMLERWYDMKIVIRDQKLKDAKFTGTFQKETIEQALEALSYPVPFRYTVKKDSVLITAK